MEYGDRVRCEKLDASDPAALDRLMADGPDVAIDLLPPSLIGAVARAAVKHRVHLVNTMYTTPELAGLAAKGEERGIQIVSWAGK